MRSPEWPACSMRGRQGLLGGPVQLLAYPSRELASKKILLKAQFFFGADAVVGSIVAPTRAIIEGGGSRADFERLKLYLTALAVGYLTEMSAAKA